MNIDALDGSSTPARPIGSDSLSQLFRHTLAQSRIHPLYPLIRRYRQALTPTAGATAAADATSHAVEAP
jgi:hypothetical protein